VMLSIQQISDDIMVSNISPFLDAVGSC